MKKNMGLSAGKYILNSDCFPVEDTFTFHDFRIHNVTEKLEPVPISLKEGMELAP